MTKYVDEFHDPLEVNEGDSVSRISSIEVDPYLTFESEFVVLHPTPSVTYNKSLTVHPYIRTRRLEDLAAVSLNCKSLDPSPL